MFWKSDDYSFYFQKIKDRNDIDFMKKGNGILSFLNVQNKNLSIAHFSQIMFISLSSLYELQIALC